jgi:hypothetical protein
MFNVLRISYTPYMDFYAVRWVVIGQASSMEDAKSRFGGYPVLEAVK